MARRPRPQIPGGCYHITMRGNGRRVVFLTSSDSERFLSLLAKVQERREWQIFGFCLMANHYHLIVRTPEPDIGAGMQYLNSHYAQGFNARHGLAGHVFQRRYHSQLIDSDEQLKETVRYVALNPVRAHLCLAPHEWAFSSYRALIELEPSPPFLDAAWVRNQFASVQSLERFVADGVPADLPMPTPWY